MNKGELLAYGRFSAEECAAIDAAAEQSAFSLHTAESLDDASRWLDAHSAQALVVGAEGAESFAVQIRSSARYAQLPMLALYRELGDLSFNDAFSWGADDVIQLDGMRPLLTRLRALPRQQQSSAVEPRGNALVAEAEQTRRVVVGRVLRNAGYSVTFAVNAQDARAFSQNPEMSLVVLSSELERESRACIEAARQTGSNARFIVCCPPRELKQSKDELAKLTAVSAVDAFAPPENVLFAANELRGGVANNRASARILYGTLVAFRGAGKDQDEFGFSYNVSGGGLYVRTLAPPEDDEVWIELCPPRSERRVRLVAQVAWRRRFGPSGNATVPPGFGARIVDGARKDVEAWQSGYNSLLEALG